MKILAIGNQKGGVAKTTTTHNLGGALAAAGLRVLLIDADPQSSLTQAAGVEDSAGASLAEVLGGSQPGKQALSAIIRRVAPGLALVPADIALASVELGLTSRLGREGVLKKALANLPERYDIVLIDCPPSLGLLTVAALVAADSVLIPTQPQAIDLRGLRLFLETLDTIKTELNPALTVFGVLVTFYDNRLTHHRAAVESMTGAGLPVLPVRIGRSVRVAEAAGMGQSVIEFDPTNPQAENYRQLAELVQTWLKNNPT